jgi:hypothetical protein
MAILTTQEKLFMRRVGLKHNKFPKLSISAAMQAVCQDDQRIFELFITMPEKARAELVSGFSKSVYLRIRNEASQS